jgi:hypothetical protein
VYVWLPTLNVNNVAILNIVLFKNEINVRLYCYRTIMTQFSDTLP